jgi:hypothetical protein
MEIPERSGANDRYLSSAKSSSDNEPPPVLKTWPRVYTFVISYLLFLIALFYLFTARFAP